jgi:ribonuclease P/MRP protein subunit RPP1
MTVYLDLNVSSNQGEGESPPEEMATISRILGFSGLGFTDFSQIGDYQKFKEIFSNLPVRAYSRVNLNFDSVSKSSKMLNQVRRFVDIAAVACLNRRLAVWAAKNSDVDLLYFPDIKLYKQVDKSLVGLIYSSENAVEISIRPILLTKGLVRANILGILRKTSETILREQATLVLTSDAHNKYQLRPPRGLAALGTLLEIPYEKAIEAVSKNPLKILERRTDSN